MARCKCKICGTQLNTTEAYKITDKNGKNKYYCSASEFEIEEARKKKIAEDKDKVYRLICDILGEKEVLNTALWKEKALWNKAFSDEIIAKYLAEHKDYLTLAVSKLSGTEYAKIRYVSAVLKNSLRDFKPKVEVVEKPRVVVTEEHYETKYKPKARMALEDLEEGYDE
jgi:hypothetical protein